MSVYIQGFPDGSVVRDLSASAEDAGHVGLIQGGGRSFRGGNDTPLQHYCLGNFMDRGAWQATVHGVARVGHDLVIKPPQNSKHVRTKNLQRKKNITSIGYDYH